VGGIPLGERLSGSSQRLTSARKENASQRMGGGRPFQEGEVFMEVWKKRGSWTVRPQKYSGNVVKVSLGEGSGKKVTYTDLGLGRGGG